jgi:hypothetical protein
MFVRTAVALGLAVALLPGTQARGEATVHVSLSAEDPEVQTADIASGDEIDFHLFAGGRLLRGCEIGVKVEGADFLRFLLPSDEPWIAMPMRNPYPGTIAQVIAGQECPPPPLLLGTVTVKPHEPGGRIVVDVVPSATGSHAMLLNCNNSAHDGFRVFPATVNPGGEPEAPHRLDAEPYPTGPGVPPNTSDLDLGTDDDEDVPPDHHPDDDDHDHDPGREDDEER